MKTVLILFCAISIGFSGAQTISPFELLDVTSGGNVSTKACAGCSGVVIFFTSNDCPYDQQYAERINKLAEKYSSKVSFYHINASPGSDEDESKMKETAAKRQLKIPYLSDKKQIAMGALQVKKSPEALLLKPDGGKLKVIYRGPIDDNPQVHHDADNNYLADAIEALLAGKNPKVSTERVVGCTIRKAS